MKIGIDLGGSHIGVGIIQGGKVVYKVEKDLKDKKKGEENILKLIILEINSIISQNNLKLEEIEKIGIACPGIVEKGVIRRANNLKIEKTEIQDKLKKVFKNINIQVRNDAKCAALAEKEYGTLHGYNDSIMLTIGTGIGGAVFYNGSLLEGKKSSAFELGHMIINKNGEKCSCNSKGCFEAYASIGNLRKKVQKELKIEKEITGIELVKLLKNEDKNKTIDIILKDYINNLAIGIANLINIFEPEIIALGGSIVYYEDIILQKLKDILEKEEYIFNKNNIPKIVMARLNNDAGMIGATI